MNRQLRAWSTIIGLKERALKKSQRALAACIAQRKLCEDAQAEAQAQLQQAKGRAQDCASEVAEMLSQPGGFSPQHYLAHDSFRRTLIEQVNARDAACQQARAAVDAQEAVVSRARTEVARGETSLESCRDMRGKLDSALQVAAEIVADDDSAETSAGRQHRKRLAEQADQSGDPC